MRSQLLPRILCLFTVLFLCISSSALAATAFKTNTESTVNKTVKSITGTSYYFNIPVAHQHQNVQKEVSPQTHLTATVNNPILMDKIPFDEVSFKNRTNIGSEIHLVNTNKHTDFASSQSFFKKGMFYGFALMVILLNMVCFFLFEEKVFLFYSFAVTGVAVTFIYSDNLFPVLGLNGIENAAAMQSTLLLIATAFSALFASKYLNLEEFYPKLKWATMSLLGLAFMMVFSGWISETAFYTGVANSISFGVLAVYFTAGIVLFSKKNYAKFYAIAFSIPLLFTLDYFVFKNLGIDFLSTESFHQKAAFLVEMLIITYAIVYRMRAIKEEHLLRQTEMRIFLKRQEVINRTNTEKLMQDMYLENLIMQYDLDGFEIKLLQYISEGKDNVKIARKLKTTELEIEALTKELYNKLDIGEQIQEDFRMVETQPDYIYN
jgi:hypothetical protein